VSRLHLTGGIVAAVSASRHGGGIRVTLTAEPSPAKEEYDRMYNEAMADYLHTVATGGYRRLPLPRTGAQRFMADVALLRSDRSLPPDDLVTRVGGVGFEWSVEWTSTRWQPASVLLVCPRGLRHAVDIP